MNEIITFEFRKIFWQKSDLEKKILSRPRYQNRVSVNKIDQKYFWLFYMEENKREI